MMRNKHVLNETYLIKRFKYMTVTIYTTHVVF